MDTERGFFNLNPAGPCRSLPRCGAAISIEAITEYLEETG
jgi:hypothetical protein